MADFKLRSLDEDDSKITVRTEETNKEQSVEEGKEVQEPVQEQVQEQAQEQVQEEVQEPVQEEKQETVEVSDEDRVREYLSKYDLNLDDVLSNNDKQEDKIELTEDVEAFLKYQKETGRGLSDYMNLSKDYDSMSELDLLKSYIKENKPHFDDEDISYHIGKHFLSDDDDSEDSKRDKKLALKEELYKAKEHFSTQKEKYYKPLESSEANVPEQYKEAFNFYSEYKQNQEKQDSLVKQRAEVFKNKTDELFNQIEGFEFDLGEKKQVYKLKDKESVKSRNSNIANFVGGFLNEKGEVSDAVGYHKAMTVANNPDAFAKYFYDLGTADAVNGLVKETKNIDMSVKQNVVTGSDGATKFRAVTEDAGSRLKIRKRS